MTNTDASKPEPKDRAKSDPRRARTKRSILSAARELFSHAHPEGVTTDEVIRAAGISKQTFYNHFADKDELAAEILHEARVNTDRIVAKAYHGETDPARRIAIALCVYAAATLEDNDLGRILTRLSFHNGSVDAPDNAPVIRDVGAGIESGRLAVQSLEAGVAFVIGASRSVMEQILLEPHPAMARTTSQQFVILLLRAFGLEPLEAERIATETAQRFVPRGY